MNTLGLPAVTWMLSAQECIVVTTVCSQTAHWFSAWVQGVTESTRKSLLSLGGKVKVDCCYPCPYSMQRKLGKCVSAKLMEAASQLMASRDSPRNTDFCLRQMTGSEPRWTSGGRWAGHVSLKDHHRGSDGFPDSPPDTDLLPPIQEYIQRNIFIGIVKLQVCPFTLILLFWVFLSILSVHQAVLRVISRGVGDSCSGGIEPILVPRMAIPAPGPSPWPGSSCLITEWKGFWNTMVNVSYVVSRGTKFRY